MSYLWLLHELSMALTCAIYGSYMSYLWLLHELSMALTCAIYGSYGGNLATWQAVSVIIIFLFWFYKLKYCFPARA